MRTQGEFFAALAKCRNGWQMLNGVDIRRGNLHDYEPCCPITAVAQMITGTWHNMDDYRVAAEDIGLPALLAARIVRAADAKTIEPRLRKRILAALGLEEATR